MIDRLHNSLTQIVLGIGIKLGLSLTCLLTPIYATLRITRTMQIPSVLMISVGLSRLLFSNSEVLTFVSSSAVRSESYLISGA
jgi:hypothetical protein